MGKSEEVRMTYSGIIPQKDGKKIARVVFERGKDTAEGVVPSGKIERFSGFTAEEAAQLGRYLMQHENEILAKAREVHPLRNWLGKGPK
ncbi:MAG: hypothetical protein HFH38_13365 [Lachnospiraceae bacterium]|jgi:hypothetical protein|nr:hypothetical protein [Lachnospiraceae bacterium]